MVTLGENSSNDKFEWQEYKCKLHPSTPVEILGMNEPANAGDEFMVVNNEEEAKQISDFEENGNKKKNT